jgi:DNA-binding NtrC family response regulator
MGDQRRDAILCVDDEVVILLALKQELKRRFGSRFSVETALDPEQAIGIVEELDSKGVRTAIVITDWIMPGMRGDGLVRTLKERWPGIKSILMSGIADEESVREARRTAGFSACMSKPWRADELGAAIEACLAE